MITFLAIAILFHQRNHKKIHIDFKDLDVVMKQFDLSDNQKVEFKLRKPSLNKNEYDT